MDSDILSSIKVRIHGSCFSVDTKDKKSLPVVTISNTEDDVTEFSPGETVEFYIPYRSSEREHNLSFQFQLSEDAEAGTYPWPITVTIYPA